MTRFDFKKWVVEHKHGKQSLNEQRMGDKPLTTRKGGRTPAPETACGSYTSLASECNRFSKCVNGLNDGSNLVIIMGGAFGIITDFYDEMCPGGCQINDVVEDSLGEKWIYEGNGILQATTGTSSTISLVGPSVCGIFGCMDNTATNYDPLATIDDGSCIFNTGFTSCQNCCCKELGGNEMEEQRRGGIEPTKTKSAVGLGGIDAPTGPQSIVGGCQTGTDFAPDLLSLDPVTGQCDCGPTNPYQGSSILSTPNMGQC